MWKLILGIAIGVWVGTYYNCKDAVEKTEELFRKSTGIEKKN